MKAEFYTIGEWIIMEIWTGTEYEYYARRADNQDAVFGFQFGSEKRFDEGELETLIEVRYIED